MWKEVVGEHFTRWYDENGKIRKTLYSDIPRSEFYYDENGRRHREDGPAVVIPKDSDKEYYTTQWYWHGIRIQCTTLEEFKKMLRLKAFW